MGAGKSRATSIRDYGPSYRKQLKELFPLFDLHFQYEVEVNKSLYYFVRDGKFKENRKVVVRKDKLKSAFDALWHMGVSKSADTIDKREYAKLIVKFMHGMQLWLLEESMKSLKIVVAAICKSGGIRSTVYQEITRKLKEGNEEIMHATEYFINHERVKSFASVSWAELDSDDIGWISKQDLEANLVVTSKRYWDGRHFIQLLHDKVQPFLKSITVDRFNGIKEEHNPLDGNRENMHEKTPSIIDVLDYEKSRGAVESKSAAVHEDKEAHADNPSVPSRRASEPVRRKEESRQSKATRTAPDHISGAQRSLRKTDRKNQTENPAEIERKENENADNVSAENTLRCETGLDIQIDEGPKAVLTAAKTEEKNDDEKKLF